jgi:hypothetical protein
LPSGWLECDGSTISDADSPLNGQAVPDINGNNDFIACNKDAPSGTHSALSSHRHSVTDFYLLNSAGSAVPTKATPYGSYAINVMKPAKHYHACGTQWSDYQTPLPPYYQAVAIIRIK